MLLSLRAAQWLPDPVIEAANCRGRIAHQCRQHLVAVVGAPVAQTATGQWPYLDAERDAPHIVAYLLDVHHIVWQDTVFELVVLDRFSGIDVDARENRTRIAHAGASTETSLETLYLYNWTTPCGQGYHFDALLPQRPPAITQGRNRTTSANPVTACPPTATPSDACPSTVAPIAHRECRTPAQDLAQLRTLLQSFFDARGADLAVSDADAENVLACGQDREALTTTLHTLLQAGLVYADSGMHAARRLMEQWLAYHAVCTQGPGRKLREGLPQDANPQSLELASSAPGSRPAVGLPRRLRGKQPDPHRLNPSTPVTSPQLPQTHADVAENPMQAVNDIFSLRIWPREDGNEDPRARRDLDIQQAAELLTESPTLPASTTTETARDRAYLLPPYHCAFRSCVFTCSQQSELEQHLVQTHQSLLLPLSLHPHVTHTSLRQALYETYLHLLQYRCQQLAPVANCSVDRRCLKQFRKSFTEGTLGAAVCFVCARRYPFMPACRNTCITWVQARDPKTRLVLGQTSEKLEEILGWKTFEQRYILPLDESTQSSLRSEMDSWTCHFRSAEYDVMLVACSEDKRCSAVSPCRSNRMCALCEVPLCKACQDSLYGCQRKPAEALSNNMVLGHPPRDLYAQECTVLELLCASPCMTALTCYSIEWRHLSDRSLAQDAFMNRHRLCAKGNATAFPLQWEDLLSELQQLDTATDPAAPCLLPHLGSDLRNKVAVLIKVGKKQDLDVKQHIVHQAVVRRRVVVALIAAMVARGHPAYRNVDMVAVTERATMLPEHDVPQEVVAMLENDDSLSHIQRQKAANAVNTVMTEAQITREFARMLKPNAVVLEKTCAGFQDVNAQQVTRLENIVHETHVNKPEALPEVVLYTGTKLLDQFQSNYFALAFPFVFPFGLGMPDPPEWSKQQRPRHADEPWLTLSGWVRAMARRVEAQVSRDWVFGFTAWNLLFRSSLNLSRTTDAYSQTYYDEDEQAWIRPTESHIEAAAKQLLAALQRTYTDVHGTQRAVKGDMTKLRYVRGLKPMARKLLKNIRHTAQGLPGTQEARKRMRFEIQAMRIRYGVPLFVTFTPDEAHQLLFVRMSRIRTTDPVRAATLRQDFPAGGMDFPRLSDTSLDTSPFETEFSLPMSWADRREVLARDPLAAVDGFRVLTHLMLKHLFGVRSCPMCPECNFFDARWEPCQDKYGSNAEPSGGIFGRVDAVYITLEAQKSTGSIHGHAQVFVQCLHQLTYATRRDFRHQRTAHGRFPSSVRTVSRTRLSCILCRPDRGKRARKNSGRGSNLAGTRTRYCHDCSSRLSTATRQPARCRYRSSKMEATIFRRRRSRLAALETASLSSVQ